MSRLYLVRHGESVWNRDGIVQGQAGPGLTSRGHEQAHHLAAWLLEEVGDDAAFVSSDLQRCRETAAPFAAELGRDPAVDEAVRERHFGTWQGLSREELAAREPERWRRFQDREDIIAEAGGESTADLNARVVPRLRAIAAAAPVTVVVTHGGPVWHGTHALLGVDEGVLGFVSNAGVTVLDVTQDHATLLAWNQVGHVPPALRTTWPSPRVAGA